MSLNATPRGDRIHIALFGKRNAGKSSVINAMTNQELAKMCIRDRSTGLYYLNAWYYNPEDGRFMTEDTYLSLIHI